MPLDEKFRRAFELLQPEVARMLDRQRAKIAGYDDVRWDEASGEAAYFRGGAALWRPQAEALARFTPELGLFRWSWAGRAVNAQGRARVDLAFREAHEMNIHEVQQEQVYVDTEREAEMLAAVGAQLARADGMLKVNDGARTVFVALFEPPRSAAPVDARRSSMPSKTPAPPHAVDVTAHEPPIPAGASFRPAVVGSARPSQAPPGARSAPAPGLARMPSMAPIAPIPVVASDDPWDAPGPSLPQPPAPPRESRPIAANPALPVREPSPTVFRPVAQLALGALSLAMPQGFREAMFLMSLDVQDSKGRFFVHLVGASATGELVSVEPSRELLEATARMVTDDAREGNGRWRKLTATFSATGEGVAVDLDVKR